MVCTVKDHSELGQRQHVNAKDLWKAADPNPKKTPDAAEYKHRRGLCTYTMGSVEAMVVGNGDFYMHMDVAVNNPRRHFRREG